MKALDLSVLLLLPFLFRECICVDFEIDNSTLEPVHPLDAKTLARVKPYIDSAKKVIDAVTSTYTDNLLLSTALKNDGGITKQQLHVLFHKCITPGSSIVLGSVGGSITAGAGAGVGEVNVYVHRLEKFFNAFCPKSTITTFNAARGGTGSLVTGMCLPTILGPKLDLLTIEFSLNDFDQYTIEEEFSSGPYELLIRNALTAFQHAPAIFNIFFWGKNFTRESGQDKHDVLAQYYDVTGISMKDVVMSCIDNKIPPYLTRESVLADPRHHPQTKVHTHLGDILALYISKKFLEWVESGGPGFDSHNEHLLLPFSDLPKPMHSELGEFDLVRNTFKCEIGGEPRQGPAPALYESSGWELFPMGKKTDIRNDSKDCFQATVEDAAAILSVYTGQGQVIISSCNQIGKRDEKPSFELRLLEYNSANQNEESDPEPIRTVLKLQPVIGQIGEAFKVVPPLSAGRHTIEIVPLGVCPSIAHTTMTCFLGFSAVITL